MIPRHSCGRLSAYCQANEDSSFHNISRGQRRVNMAKGDRSRRSLGSRLFGLINPIRDPSLLIAIVLTVLYVSGAQHASPLTWLLFGIGFWIAVKAIIWLLVNFAFSFVYLLRKSGWVVRNPRLAWRLLDAL